MSSNRFGAPGWRLSEQSRSQGLLEAQKREGQVTRVRKDDPVETWMDDANCAGLNPESFFPHVDQKKNAGPDAGTSRVRELWCPAGMRQLCPENKRFGWFMGRGRHHRRYFLAATTHQHCEGDKRMSAAVTNTERVRRPYVEKRRPSRQAAVVVRMSKDERDALHRIAAARGTNVNALLLSKVQTDLRRELQSKP